MKHTKLAAFAAAALMLGTASCSQHKEDVAPARLHQAAGASDTDDETPVDPNDITPVEPDYDLPEDGDPSADNNLGYNTTPIGGRKVRVSFSLDYAYARDNPSYQWKIRTTFQRNPATQSPTASGSYASYDTGRLSVNMSFPLTGVWTISLYEIRPGGRTGGERVLASRNVTVY